MRKIYTLLLALVASMTAFAQNPDPSKWEKGQKTHQNGKRDKM